MKTLQKFPKDYPFTVRVGGKVYIRGGDRYDPSNPDAIPIPTLTNKARSRFVRVSKEDILTQGEKAEDQARDEAFRRGEADNREPQVNLIYTPYTYWQILNDFSFSFLLIFLSLSSLNFCCASNCSCLSSSLVFPERRTFLSVKKCPESNPLRYYDEDMTKNE